MSGLFGLLTLLLAGLWLLDWATRESNRGHKWRYRNPATRTCERCDRQEDNYCSADAYARSGVRASGWWEEMRPGAGKYCIGHKKHEDQNDE